VSAGRAERSIAAALEMFGRRPDPRLAALAGWEPARRPAAALLASAVGQDLTVGGATRLVREMRTELGAAALEATPADWPSLVRFSRRAWLADWAHREALPGWILAVSDFLRSHGDPARWPVRGEPIAWVRLLAAEVPWMGARSAHRVKAWRLVRWIGRGELGTESDPGFRASLRIPHPAVERPLGALSILPPGWEGWTRPRKQEWLDGICRGVRPADPASAWPALETVLGRGTAGPSCQEHLGSCGNCALRGSCPSPARG
jgi:hypothetical protein